MKQLTGVLFAAVLVVGGTAHAQFVGGAPPAGTTLQVYAVTGVASAPGLSTLFNCTNTGPTASNVAVQVFDQNGSAMNASPALSVPPGGTAQFATTNSAPFVPDQQLLPVNNFTKGSAKIWSNSKSLICGAMLATGGGGLSSLTIVSKVKQKGD